MSPSAADNWTPLRAAALLAAVFAVVFGALMPFGAMAAVQPGQPLILCTTQGPQTIQTGGLDGPIRNEIGAACAACLLPVVADLPPPPEGIKLPVALGHALHSVSPRYSTPEPASRARLRPPSTAPPLSA